VIVVPILTVGDRADPIREPAYELSVVMRGTSCKVKVPIQGNGTDRASIDAEVATDARRVVNRHGFFLHLPINEYGLQIDKVSELWMNDVSV